MGSLSPSAPSQSTKHRTGHSGGTLAPEHGGRAEWSGGWELTCRRLCPERWVTPDEAGGTSEPKVPLLQKGSAMGPKLGGSGKCEGVAVGGGR